MQNSKGCMSSIIVANTSIFMHDDSWLFREMALKTRKLSLGKASEHVTLFSDIKSSHPSVLLQHTYIYGYTHIRLAQESLPMKAKTRAMVHADVVQFWGSRCHGEFGTPGLQHPHTKFPRELGTPE